jgi:hypothetical protein
MPKERSKPEREKPLSLHGITPEEALKKALSAKPPKKARKKPASKHKR